MKIDAKITDMINKQINKEIHSAYLYLSMSMWLESQGLPGMAKWMKTQWHEELEHAEKFMSYLNDRSGEVVLTQIAGPKKTWDSAMQVFEEALDHENFITQSIWDISMAANEQGDMATHKFLHCFEEEQVEEESMINSVLDKFKYIGEDGKGMLMLDKELGLRE